MTFTLGHANIQQTDRMGDEVKTLGVVTSHADIVTWNEARDAKGPLDALPGWDSVVAGGLGISWKTDKFELVESGHKVVMQGGFVGADGVHTAQPGDDDRRVGPSRLVLWAVRREKATSKRVIAATHHGPAKGDTTAQWRRGLRARAWANVVTELRAVRKKYPDAKLILTGDLNTIGRITAFLALGIREAKTPATFGKRLRYDRIFGEVSNVRTLRTLADHLALLATVTLAGEAVPLPPGPVAPPPSPRPRRPRRPLNPWSRQGRRIRRRNPRRWRRIRRAFRRWRNRRRNP